MRAPVVQSSPVPSRWSDVNLVPRPNFDILPLLPPKSCVSNLTSYAFGAGLILAFGAAIPGRVVVDLKAADCIFSPDDMTAMLYSVPVSFCSGLYAAPAGVSSP